MSDAVRADALLDEMPREGRGRLKVFLGAAPGVGKTYAMLQAAQAQLRQGVDLRVGVVETHGRAETEAMLTGLPQQPQQRLEYRGVALSEMDLDGILAKPPKLLLVDELAHSNAPGSRHSKRWQDVQELLDAGIDVYTTVNVQHLEALNDQVRDITGVQVRETLPDWVLQEADEILLIDLPPRELLERLREGKVYVPEQARAAIDAFFSQTNLTALRELAMQTAAARVDADLSRRYRQQGQQAPALRGRLLVGIDGDAQAERLVRHACRVAERRHLPWSVVYVDTGGERDETRLSYLQGAQQLAERLGGEVVSLRGSEVAKTLIEHARERRAQPVPQYRRRLEIEIFRRFGHLALKISLHRARFARQEILRLPHQRVGARRAGPISNAAMELVEIPARGGIARDIVPQLDLRALARGHPLDRDTDARPCAGELAEQQIAAGAGGQAHPQAGLLARLRRPRSDPRGRGLAALVEDGGLAAAKDREAVAEAIRRDEELSSGAVQGRTHEEVMRAARRAIGCT